MQENHFIWDECKNEANIKKHSISFNEATTVFDDEYAVYFDDGAHSQEGERFIIIGMSDKYKILMVCRGYRNGGNAIRIISARRANKKENFL